MSTISRLVAYSLTAMFFLGACGEATASSPDSPGTEPAVVSNRESGAATLPDADACAAMRTLIDEIGHLNRQGYEDSEGVRDAMTGTLAAMEAVEDTAPTTMVADGMALLLQAWRPWHDEMEAVDFDFFALDPRVFERFDDPETGPEAFTARSEHVLSYAVDNCGVAQATVDAATGADRPTADVDPDQDADMTLVETGVTLMIWIEGEERTLDRGFCEVGPDGLLVGSYESGETKVSILYDTSGDGLATISVEHPGSVAGAQVEFEYGDGQGAFRSGAYVGTFTCGS